MNDVSICPVCSALVMGDGDDEYFMRLHRQWHEDLSGRIHDAAQVGAHADMMTRPIGGGGPLG